MNAIKTVNFYRPKGHNGPLTSNELVTLCGKCAKKRDDIELVDVAGEFDECEECDTQNVPAWYHEN